jgi:hypothetical protein
MLKGKIIKILDDRRVIVNLGFKDGVKKDMKFIIYDEGEEIIDPESKTSLGKREIVKHRIKSIHIQENFSIMVSDVWISTILDRLFDADHKTQKKLLLEEDVKRPEDIERAIKVGDLVRQEVE